jgi:hypothetical protein
MTTEPMRPNLQQYLQERHDNAMLPATYREPLAPVRQEAFTIPPELLAGLLVDRQAAHQRELALVTQNAHLQAAAQANTQMSGKAKDIAVVSAAGGVGVGAATTGIGFAAGMIGANAHGLLVAAIAFAIGTGCIALLKLLFGGASMLRPGGNHYETHIHNEARGMFAKAISGPTSNG